MIKYLGVFLALCLGSVSAISQSLAVPVETPAQWAEKNAPALLPLYRDFHQHPELSFQEARTADVLLREWRAAGHKVTPNIGGHGVVGVLENGPGPRLLLRTDMDALPLEEKTGLDYASRVKVKNDDGSEVGVMHACGHDIHLTSLVGVARFLSQHRADWSGTIVFIGQPAEERGRGARDMLKDGLYRKFGKPDYALALHVDNAIETGKIGYHAGPTMAGADSVDITVRGKSGHGAMPNLAVDPIVMAAQLVVDLQTLVSRESDPVEPAVITVGSIHGGTKHNLIPDTCHLQLSVRSGNAAQRTRLLDGIRRKAFAVAMGAGAPDPIVKVGDETTPALFNDPKLVARLVPVFQHALGEANVVPTEAAMVSEDFSRYTEGGVPVFLFRLGSVSHRRLAGSPSLHSSAYYPDAAQTLVTGITAMSAAVIELLPAHRSAGRQSN